MLHRTFDPKKPFRVVLYLRMSTTQQNPRSPDQQRDTIEAAFRRLGYPWVVVAVYTDAGISVRLVSKRPGVRPIHPDLAQTRLRRRRPPPSSASSRSWSFVRSRFI